jgi:hypothetical protein
LRDAEIDQTWNIANILTRATAVDCGPITVNFFNDDAPKSPLDSSIFGDIRVTTGAFLFRDIYTEDVSKKGVYPIKFEAYHTNYNSNVATLGTPFIITIIDPCDEPVSVTTS